MKKWLSLLLVASFLMSFAAVSVAEEAPVVSALVYASQLPAEENSILDEIRARTGINFQPTVVEGGAYTEKFNTLAAAGMLPDIVKISGYSQIQELVEYEVILPLDELLEKCGQDILENMGHAIKDTIANVDGKIYGLPLEQERLTSLMVRQDWLDNLGLEIPTTLEDFYKVAVAFTKDDPDKDGKDDTVALAATMNFPATMQFLFTAHGVPFGRNCYVDGKVVPWYMHPDYMKAIEYIRKLYQEGLMEQDFVTIANLDSLAKLWDGTHGFYFGDPIGTTNNWVLGGRYTENPQPVMTYTYIANEAGVGGSLKAHTATFWAITSTCKDPEAAMKLLNFFATDEGNKLAYAGIQGKHWDYDAEGKLVYLNEYADSAVHRNDGGYAYFPVFRRDGMERQILTPATVYGYQVAEAHQIEDAWLWKTPESSADITFDSDVMLASLVTSTGDIYAEYEAFIQEYLDNGGEAYIEEATEIYKEENNL